MAETTADEVIHSLDQVNQLYYRLMLLVAPAGGGKTAILQAVAKQLKLAGINLNLELSRRLLELTEKERTLKLPQILQNIVEESNQNVVLLDNTETLFAVDLAHDPLRLLQKIARSRTVIATWNGEMHSGFLTYAIPSHPEYRKYPIKDFLAIEIEQRPTSRGKQRRQR